MYSKAIKNGYNSIFVSIYIFHAHVAMEVRLAGDFCDASDEIEHSRNLNQKSNLILIDRVL